MQTRVVSLSGYPSIIFYLLMLGESVRILVTCMGFLAHTGDLPTLHYDHLNPRGFNELLAFTARRGLWEEASDLLTRATRRNISDVASYTSVIAAYAKHRQLWEKALVTLRAVPKANIFSYGAAIGWGEESSTSAAERIAGDAWQNRQKQWQG
eukprot:Skav205582  [mRNA]  locus=scaffold460:59897:62507:+ [translate_table: standard]